MVALRGRVLVLAVALAGCSGGDGQDGAPAAAPSPPPPPPPAAAGGDVFARIPSIVDRVEPSVVAVLVRGTQGEGEGSGVIWDANGTMVTNNHVVEGASEIQVVLASGARLEAEVEAADVLTDLAVIRVDRDGLPAADFAADLPQVGELALAIGNPLGFEQTVTAGIVSGVHRSIPSGGQTPALVDLLQTDAPISPGNSGGALVDADGEVIGINVAYIPPQARAVSLGFAIPSPTVVDVVRELLERGEVRHAFLGIRPAEVTQELGDAFQLGAEEGVLVQSVEEGSAADEAGIEAGDVLVRLGNRELRTVEDLFGELRSRDPGESVGVTVVRDGDRVELDVTLAARPSE